MRSTRVLIVCALFALAAPAVEAQQRDPIARLEAARAANPRNVAALRALGVAYYKANRFADASSVLDQARRLDPRDGVSALYAGLAAEGTQNYAAAKSAYEDYLKVGRSRRTRTDIQQRLVAIARLEVIASARAAVANEATLAQTPGDRRTIAVPPFKFSGPDAEMLQPLERGFAELMITDLSRSAQLTVVERDRMQAIADEIQLGQSDRVDAASAVRAGKLIRAGRLVNGSLVQTPGNQLTIESNVIDVSTSELTAPVSVSNNLDNLFAMQKQLVLRVFDQLGVTLTPAERQLVDRQSTTNLNAFLAYSRGLMAADDGRFEDASRYFQEARSLDPGFGAAGVRFQAAQAAAVGTQVTAATIEGGLQGSESQTVTSAQRGETVTPSTTLNTVSQTVNPPSVTPISNSDRGGAQAPPPPNLDQSTNTTGLDQPTPRTGTVTIIIRRP
jgi:tetratricopeptide (TPR) repeat protein